MKNRYLANTLLVAISLLLSLVVCEIVVRMLNLAPEVVYVEKWRVRLSENPRIGYEPIPNLDSTGKSVQFYSYIGRSNGMGYRDYDHPMTKEPGSKRVLVIGDSVTAGLWINDDSQIFTSVMERSLGARGIGSDVMNFGVSGYNTRQEVETLKVRGLPFKPDVVVLAYCLNDRSQDDGNIYGLLLAEEKEVSAGNALNTARTSFLVRHSALLRMIAYKVLPSSFKVERGNAGDAVQVFYADSVEESFAELAELGRSHGFEVVVAVFPDFGEADKGLEGAYGYAAEHANIARLSRKHGFHHLDMLEPFRACRKNAPAGYTISYDRYHPNEIGNRCAGEGIADAVSTLLSADQ